MPLKDPEARRLYDREYARRYGPQHRAERAAALREWRARNADSVRARTKAYNRAYYAANRDREHDRYRQRYTSDPAPFAVRRERWNLANPEHAHELRVVRKRRRRAAALSNGGAHTAAEWAELQKAFEFRCGYCGRRATLEADHRVPLCRGGTDDIANIIPACRACNARKSTKTEIEFREQMARETLGKQQTRHAVE